MRVLRRFPRLEAALRDGRLCLSTLALLGQVLTDENADDLLARAAYRTKAEVDSLVASVKPRPAPVEGIRKKSPRPEVREPGRDPRAIAIEVRRAVWKRDGRRCTWKGQDGHRCDSRWQLELDHIEPLLLGGRSTVENLRLRCRAHNLLHAERIYGREHMDRFRREQAPNG